LGTSWFVIKWCQDAHPADPELLLLPEVGDAIPIAGGWLGFIVGQDPNRYRAVLDEPG
jgi:hypothetical protein